ncbi:MAG: excisionase family DNA-binding protein [candidate division Zixibacteria bacterium]|nr:excisionase family DNA-binding protein [candidate division Zixibacteria bacterium]
MPDDNREKDYLTTTQAAKLLSVSPDTVLKWVKAGKVKSYRTLGGHFRIPISELRMPESGLHDQAPPVTLASDTQAHQYCWEFLAAGGKIKAECMDCITYRSRARRCYELKDLPGEFGCLNLLCDTDCNDCDYFKVVSGQGINVLILTGNRRLVKGINRIEQSGLQIRFASGEYETAVAIQSYRPDYIVIDCAFGKKRTANLCSSLFSDIRIPVARIILSSKTRTTEDYCDHEVFGWIRKPFSVEELNSCIRGVPKLADKQITIDE